MSHDRGCFICHEDPIAYASCRRSDCPKRERFAVEPGGDKSDAPTRPGPFVGDPGYRSGGDEEAKRRDNAIAEHRRLHDEPAVLMPKSSAPERVTRIITVTEPGYDVALFFNEDGGAEAVITRPGLSPTGVNIAPPAPGRRIVIERVGPRFEVVYKDVPK